MLAIPILKVSTAPVLDTSGLYRYLTSQQPNSIPSDITAFTNLRTSATSFSEPTDVAVQQLLEYCHQLKSFTPRFQGVEGELNLTFTWSDGFAAAKKIATSSFYYEWACAMWNLAAFESLRGARVDRTSEEGIKIANKHFQQAAGYFEYIREFILPQIKIQTLPSISEDSLQMAKNLMLAQAQLCFYEKAVKDKKKDLMKSAIIAKLAAQTSVFYTAASNLCKVGLLGPLLDISWYAITDFQSKCFHGASEYWQAVASKEAALAKGSGYGEEIVRYKRAEIYVSQAIALSKKYTISPSLPAGADGLLQAILANKKTAEYDLSTVYMEGLPADSSLGEVAPVAMVKPSGLPDLPQPLGANALFKNILPRAMLESNRCFQDELQAVCTSTARDAEEATNIGRVTLSSVGLPGSLEAVKSEVPLPEGLWVKVQRVQSMGGFDRLPSMFLDLQAGARRALLTMASIDETLDREERVDSDFRARYPEWGGPKSSSLNADTRANNQRMREAYANAQQSDVIIERELKDETIVNQLKTLSNTKEQLLRLFPKPAVDLLDLDEHGGGGNTLFGPEAVRLEEKLHELVALLDARTSALGQLKVLSQLDCGEMVSNVLQSNGDLTAVQNQYLAQAREIKSKVTTDIALQHTLLNETLSLNTAFVKSRELSPQAIQNNEVIQSLEQHVAKYFSMHSQITSGITFYSNLQSKLTTLLQSSDDLAYTQQWQRSDYESSKTSAYQRTSQESQDHEYALKLANELNAADAAAASAAQPPKPPKPSPLFSNANIPGHSNDGSGGIVVGTPVSGPPGYPTPIPGQIPAIGQSPPAQQQYQHHQAPQPQVYQQPPSGAISYNSTAALPQQPQYLGSPPAAPQPQQQHQQQQQHQHQQQHQQQPQYLGAPAAAPQPAAPYVYNNPAAAAIQAPQTLQPQYVPSPSAASPPAPHPAYAPTQPQYLQPPAPQPSYYQPPPPPAAPQPQQQQYYQPPPPQQQQQPQYIPTPAQPPAAPVPPPAPRPMTNEEFTAKVNTMIEMGFSKDNSINALLHFQGNDEAALNALLNGQTNFPPPGAAPGPAGGAAAPAAGGAPAAAPAKSGFFKMWGSK